jgi:hypothetical protein
MNMSREQHLSPSPSEAGDVEKASKNRHIVESFYETRISSGLHEGLVSIAKWDSKGLTIWGACKVVLVRDSYARHQSAVQQV